MEKSAALSGVSNLILTCGFDQSLIRKDYKFVAGGLDSVVYTADFVAFSDNKRTDLGTSCISVSWVDDDSDLEEQIQTHKFLASPLVIFPSKTQVNIVDLRNSINEVQQVSYELLERHFSDHRLNYSKDALLRSKQSGQFQQLTLFAIEATRDLMIDTFEVSVRQEINNIGVKYQSEVVKMAISVLAACIIEDKLWYSNKYDSFISLLKKCFQEFPRYFNGILNSEMRLRIGGRIYERIRPQLTFQALTHDIIGYFYEFAILDASTREALGIYWTDSFIAKRIIESLPVELVPRDQIRVLDGTCGSGSLLLAACERITRLMPKNLSGQDRHNWLTEHVMGVEIDQFASDITKLSLLLYSIPYGNHWNVINSDFLKTPIPNRPTVVIGNPPFRESKSDELATKFVDKYIELLMPEGIFGIILPTNYLEGDKSWSSRKKLLGSCRIFEVWYLPEGTFRTSSVSTCVIIGQKYSPKTFVADYPVKVVEVRRDQLYLFKSEGKPSKISFVSASQWISDDQYRILSSSLDNILHKLKGRRRLGKVASISQGIIPGGNNFVDFSDVLPLETNDDKWVKWLQSPDTNILEPYKIAWRDYREHNRRYVRYPGNLHRPRPNLNFEQPKVITNAVRNSGSPWRIYGAIDRDGFYVSQSFWVIQSTDDKVSLEQIVAVINHPMSSLLLSKLNKRSYMQKKNVASIPFPEFSKEQGDEINSLVLELHKIKNDLLNQPIRTFQALVSRLDDIIYDAMGISQEVRIEIKNYMCNGMRPGDERNKNYNIQNAEEATSRDLQTWKISGVLESYDIENGTITIFLQDEGHSSCIPIPDSFPGWGLHVNRNFEAEIPFSQRYEVDPANFNFLKFKLPVYSYMSDEELEFKVFHNSGSRG